MGVFIEGLCVLLRGYGYAALLHVVLKFGYGMWDFFARKAHVGATTRGPHHGEVSACGVLGGACAMWRVRSFWRSWCQSCSSGHVTTMFRCDQVSVKLTALGMAGDIMKNIDRLQ